MGRVGPDAYLQLAFPEQILGVDRSPDMMIGMMARHTRSLAGHLAPQKQWGLDAALLTVLGLN